VNEPLEPADRDAGGADADALRARDALRALPPAAADPLYRARLKADFASGAIESSAPAPRPERHRAIPLPWFGGRSAPGWGATVAIAAIIAAIVMAGIFNQGPSWRITGVRGTGSVRIGGALLASDDAATLGRSIPAGVRVEVSDGVELDLRAGRTLAMQCTGGTDLVLPPSPPRWFGRRSALHVRSGEIRVATGPAFKGATLAVTTPEASLAVTGTTFAVILEPTGTCVCVYEGRVMVGPRTGAPAAIMGGSRRYVFRDGRPMEDASMREVEHEKLGAFRDAQIAAMKGR
jgi:FecR protein